MFMHHMYIEAESNRKHLYTQNGGQCENHRIARKKPYMHVDKNIMQYVIVYNSYIHIYILVCICGK